MNFTYGFPAVKGMQANREYYISMIPLRLLPKLFPNDEGVVLPEHRAQRRINETRIPEMRDYILDNRTTYVFSALSASIDGEFEFVGYNNSEIGVLKIDMDSIFLINDGQHRKACIEAAMYEDESLKNESISIVFFRDEGLKRSQQMFTDLNKHAVKASNSLAMLYDSRDEIAVATRSVIDSIDFFKKYTDKERDNLGKNSSKLVTLNNIYKANLRIVSSSQYKNGDVEFLINYWTLVANNINEWNEILAHQITKKSLREDYIITLSITINALGRLGKYFYDNKGVQMDNVLKKLSGIDWLRNNKRDWLNRAIREDGKVLNNEAAINLTCARIKNLIGVSLSREELAKEQELGENKNDLR